MNIRAATTFRFKMLRFVSIWLAVVTAFLVCLTAFVAARSDWAYAFHTLWIVALPLWLLGLTLLVSASDIVVDADGISKRLLGVTWKVIRWDNVSRITAFPVYGGYGYSARAFNVFPKVISGFRILPSGKMCFQDKTDRASELVGLLNEYALVYGFSLESRSSALAPLLPVTRL
jgi:hypothetical protein